MRKMIFRILLVSALLLITLLSVFASATIHNNGFYAVVKTKEGYVNFRTNPIVSGNIICGIKDGVVLFISNQKNGWGLTEYRGKHGWIALSETQKINKKPEKAGYTVYVKANDGVNFRTGPSIKNDLIDNILKGTELYVEDTLNGWGYIYYDGTYGWISLSETTVNLNSEKKSVSIEEVQKVHPEEQKEQIPDKKIPSTVRVSNETDRNIKASMFNQIILVASVVLLIIVIAVLFIIIVNLKSRR